MTTALPRDLGDGLALRRAEPADAERLAAFHASIHLDGSSSTPDESIGAWVRDLVSGRHPTFRPDDFLLVEEARSGDVVSSLCFISQTWSYDSIPFGVGRPELVATRADYRRRGLVRAQMDLVHEWSAERGELAQGITGIPNYYRQFGYEMALELEGGRSGYAPHIPRLEEGRTEPYRIRPATVADAAALGSLDRAGSRRSLVSCLRDEALWRYEIAGMEAQSINRRNLAVIETPAGESVGFLAYSPKLWNYAIVATAYELAPGASWLAVTPSVVRYLWQRGEELAAHHGNGPLQIFSLSFGSEHPAFRVMEQRLPRIRTPYAWYLRVPDLPGFLMHVAPVLEARLAGSVAPGYSGEMRINFYRGGLCMAWEEGRLAGACHWEPASSEDGAAAFPGLTFLQLLFGYRSLTELKHAFCDCWTHGDEAPVLLDALFPRRASSVWYVS